MEERLTDAELADLTKLAFFWGHARGRGGVRGALRSDPTDRSPELRGLGPDEV
jgi:hypothetical protein